jgi:competence transcription factor ComK
VLGLPFKRLSFASPQSDYNDFIYSPEEKKYFFNALGDYIFSIKDQWDVTSLQHISSESETIKQFKSVLFGKGLLTFSNVISVCPYISIKGSWDEYYTSNFKKKTRSNLSRSKANLQKHGNVSFNRLTEEEKLNETMRTVYEITKKSPKTI